MSHQRLLDKRLIHIHDRLILVPYLPLHVPKYHGWMSNEAILQQTASEPLSLEEEFQMQINWAIDEDKRTCILVPRQLLIDQLYAIYIQYKTKNKNNNPTTLTAPLNPISYLEDDNEITNRLIVDRREHLELGTCVFCQQINVQGSSCQPSSPITIDSSSQASKPTTSISSFEDNQSFFCCLLCEANAACGDCGASVAIGDVNLFFHKYFQDEKDVDDDYNDKCVGVDDDEEKAVSVAEVEIMIAEVSARRCGYGALAVKLLTQYAFEWLGIIRFISKISNDNLPSLNLFQKQLGYNIFEVVECFDEVHLDFVINSAIKTGFYPWFPNRVNNMNNISTRQ